MSNRCPICQYEENTFVTLLDDVRKMQKCLRCGLIFVVPDWNNEIAQMAFDHYTGWPRGFGGSSGNRKVEMMRIVREIQQQYPSGGTLLDIGCADGSFFESIGTANRAWKLYGVEPGAAFKNHKYHNALVCHQPLDECGYANELFDVVSVLDTIYYIPNPVQTLSSIHRILKPRGWAVIDIVGQSYLSLRAWLGRIAGLQRTGRFNAYPYYFSDTSINWLCRDGKFAIVKRLLHTGIEHPNYILRFGLTTQVKVAQIIRQVNMSPKVIYFLQKVM